MRVVIKNFGSSYIMEAVRGDYLIDDNRYNEVTKAILTYRPETIWSIKKIVKIVGYGELSVEEYIEKRDALMEGNDPSQYKEFIENNPVRFGEDEKMEKCEIVEYNIQGKTDNPYIIPYRLLERDKAADDDQIIYKYVPEPFKMACEIADRLGLEFTFSKDGCNGGMKWYVPEYSKDTLRFILIGGEFADFESLPEFNEIQYGTYEECYNKYLEHYNAIKRMFKRRIKVIESKDQPFDKAEVIRRLEAISMLVRNMKIQSSSKTTKRGVQLEIERLINEL